MDNLQLEDVLSRKPCDGNESLEFKFKPEVLNVPVLRALINNHTISPTKILSYNCLYNAVIGLGQRAGYKQTLTPYCFRRGFGHSVNSKQVLREVA